LLKSKNDLELRQSPTLALSNRKRSLSIEKVYKTVVCDIGLDLWPPF